MSMILVFTIISSIFLPGFHESSLSFASNQIAPVAMESSYRDDSLDSDKALIEKLFEEGAKESSMSLYPKNNPNDNPNLDWYEKGFDKRLITESYLLDNNQYYEVEFQVKKGDSLLGLYELFSRFLTQAMSPRYIQGIESFEYFKIKIGEEEQAISLFIIQNEYKKFVEHFKGLNLLKLEHIDYLYGLDLDRSYWGTQSIDPRLPIYHDKANDYYVFDKDVKLTLLISPKYIRDNKSGYAFARGYQLTPFHGKLDAGASNSRSITYTAGASRSHTENLSKIISTSESNSKTTSWQNTFEAGVEGGAGLNLKILNVASKWHFTYTRTDGGSNTDSSTNSQSNQYGVGNTMTANVTRSVTKNITIGNHNETVAYAVYQPFQGMMYYKSSAFEKYLDELESNCSRLKREVFPAYAKKAKEKSDDGNLSLYVRVRNYVSNIAENDASKIMNTIKFKDLSDGIVYGNNNFVVVIPKSKYIDSKATISTIDDTNKHISYLGKWRDVKESDRVNMGDINNNVKVAFGAENIGGAEIQYTFDGYGIEIFSQAKYDCQNFNVYIDGDYYKTVKVNSKEMIDALEPLNVRASVFKVKNLKDGSHTIRIVFKNDVSKVGVFDGFKVYQYNN